MIRTKRDKPMEFVRALENHPVLLALIKPKAEIYLKADLRKKTRNIIATSVVAQKLIQPVHNAFFHNKTPFKFDDFKGYPRGQ